MSRVSVSVPIWLTLIEDRVRRALVDPAAQPLDVGDEQVVADELQPVAQALGQRTPRVPVVLREAVLDRDERIPPGEPVRRSRPSPAPSASRPSKRYRPSSKNSDEAGSSAIATLSRWPARSAASRMSVDRLLGRAQVGREPALVTDRRREPALVQERAAARGRPRPRSAAPPRSVGCAGGHDHELLQVDRVVRVRAAVDHVHHRHGQRLGLLAADVPEERHARVVGGRLRRRERDAEDRVRAEAPLVRRPVELDEPLVDGALVGGVHAAHRCAELAAHVLDRAADALAAACLASPSRSSTASWAPVEAPDGTAARPSAPDSSPTSTSTVGLPRESRIWRRVDRR